MRRRTHAQQAAGHPRRRRSFTLRWILYTIIRLPFTNVNGCSIEKNQAEERSTEIE
jgi:hypothetical protein